MTWPQCQVDGNKGYIAFKDIAERQGISKKYLEQIILLLNRPQFLQTNREMQGGYRLARRPEEYPVGEILRLTEGSLAPVACLDQSPNCCTRCAECPTLLMWAGLKKVIDEYLDGITLADILEQSRDAAKHIAGDVMGFGEAPDTLAKTAGHAPADAQAQK